MTRNDGRDRPERDPGTHPDPPAAVDELEERVVGRRTDAGEAPEQDGADPVDDGSGTGIDDEPTD